MRRGVCCFIAVARQMSEDIPDLLQTRSTEYDPPRTQVCVKLFTVDIIDNSPAHRALKIAICCKISCNLLTFCMFNAK